MRQHVVTIIQGSGEVTTVPLNSEPFWAPEEYVSKALNDLVADLNDATSTLVLPLIIHYTEVDG